MPSMFRRPSEESSSDSSSSAGDDDTTNPVPDDLSLLSKINTLDSTSSGGLASGPTRPISRQNSQLRDLLLHSLLEERALTEAASRLGRDRSNPEVQELARASYQALSLQLAGSAPDVDQRLASDEMRHARVTAQRGIDDAIARAQVPQLGPQRPRALAPILSSNRLGVLFPDTAQSLPVPLPLHSYPGLHTDRYLREFVEIDTIGKGGYGKVYKVKHKLDNAFYAVKRIMVSPTRLQKIKEHGPKEMESLLEEVRALARFDHGNVVRYQNCWLEFTSAPVEAPPSALYQNDRLIENGRAQSFSSASIQGLESGISSFSLGDPFGNTNHSMGADVVFANTDPSAGDDDFSAGEANPGLSGSQMETPRRRPRRASAATIATISSTRSGRSAIANVDEEDDEGIETIPRSQLLYSEDGTSDLSESMVSHSDVPQQALSSRATGPVLTLNVQMSLYDTNLAAFLSTEQASSNLGPHLRHCFHPCISLELLDQIISGVEYLHAQGVVHRDLKPANIFLALSTSKAAPFGSVDVSTCRRCPSRDHLHITPRIGDFGLVAALGDVDMTSDAFAKPVGTEFYRPEEVWRPNEKLDIFALGVVGFEMLCCFDTRMERVDALTQLRRGKFPKGFIECLGSSAEDMGELLAGMTKPDEEERWGCEAAKGSIKKIIEQIKG